MGSQRMRIEHGRYVKATLRRRRKGWPAGVLWLVTASLALQLFITQVHAFMGELGWVGWPPSQGAVSTPAPRPGHGLHAHRPMQMQLAMAAHCEADATAASPADPHGPAPGKQPECPIFQSLHILSASLAPSAVELPPPLPQGRSIRVVITDVVAAVGICPRPQPRAPPVSA
ncbi:MAG TPA: hypothetical protein VKY65_15910 [Alphaproteobacteria bacterium]|nr:hypothetical protein [Alphaproteobacteria bacterium]